MRTERVAEQRRGVEDTSGVRVEFHMMPGQEPWIDFTLEGCSFGRYDRNAAKKTLEKLEFYSLIPRL